MRKNNAERLTSEESGAALIETALVMIMIVPTITMAMYFFILTHRLNSAHFQLQNTLRRYSVGPQNPNIDANTFSMQFANDLFQSLDSVGVKYPDTGNLKSILLRNDTTCFYITKSGYQQVASNERAGCLAASSTTPSALVANNFITVELDVGIFQNGNLDVFNFAGMYRMPTPRVISGMRMGNF